MTNETQAAIAKMQTKQAVRPLIWQNANGTWSHHKDAGREWYGLDACQTDLRFHEEWAA